MAHPAKSSDQLVDRFLVKIELRMNRCNMLFIFFFIIENAKRVHCFRVEFELLRSLTQCQVFPCNFRQVHFGAICDPLIEHGEDFAQSGTGRIGGIFRIAHLACLHSFIESSAL